LNPYSKKPFLGGNNVSDFFDFEKEKENITHPASAVTCNINIVYEKSQQYTVQHPKNQNYSHILDTAKRQMLEVIKPPLQSPAIIKTSHHFPVKRANSFQPLLSNKKPRTDIDSARKFSQMAGFQKLFSFSSLSSKENEEEFELPPTLLSQEEEKQKDAAKQTTDIPPSHNEENNSNSKSFGKMLDAFKHNEHEVEPKHASIAHSKIHPIISESQYLSSLIEHQPIDDKKEIDPAAQRLHCGQAIGKSLSEMFGFKAPFKFGNDSKPSKKKYLGMRRRV
jgi:hypothetical protein